MLSLLCWHPTWQHLDTCLSLSGGVYGILDNVCHQRSSINLHYCLPQLQLQTFLLSLIVPKVAITLSQVKKLIIFYNWWIHSVYILFLSLMFLHKHHHLFIEETLGWKKDRVFLKWRDEVWDKQPSSWFSTSWQEIENKVRKKKPQASSLARDILKELAPFIDCKVHSSLGGKIAVWSCTSVQTPQSLAYFHLGGNSSYYLQ